MAEYRVGICVVSCACARDEKPVIAVSMIDAERQPWLSLVPF